MALCVCLSYLLHKGPALPVGRTNDMKRRSQNPCCSTLCLSHAKSSRGKKLVHGLQLTTELVQRSYQQATVKVESLVKGDGEERRSKRWGGGSYSIYVLAIKVSLVAHTSFLSLSCMVWRHRLTSACTKSVSVCCATSATFCCSGSLWQPLPWYRYTVRYDNSNVAHSYNTTCITPTCITQSKDGATERTTAAIPGHVPPDKHIIARLDDQAHVGKETTADQVHILLYILG